MFKIGDRVWIVDIEMKGRIRTIWITESGTQYEVSYFVNGDAKKLYFYADELKAIDV